MQSTLKYSVNNLKHFFIIIYQLSFLEELRRNESSHGFLADLCFKCSLAFRLLNRLAIVRKTCRFKIPHKVINFDVETTDFFIIQFSILQACSWNRSQFGRTTLHAFTLVSLYDMCNFGGDRRPFPTLR
jgi:hypothetical protein